MDASAIRRNRFLSNCLVPFLQSVTSAALIAQVITVWVTLAGTTVHARLALLTAGVCSLIGWQMTVARVRRPASISGILVVFAFAVAGSFLVPVATDALLSLGANSFASDAFASQWLAFMPAALICGGLAYLALLSLPVNRSNSSSGRVCLLWGLATGALAPLLTTVWTVSAAVYVCMPLAISVLVRAIVVTSDSTEGRGDSNSQHVPIPDTVSARIAFWCSAVAAGMCLVAVWDLITLMMPGHVVLLLWSIAMTSLLLGTSQVPAFYRVVRSAGGLLVCFAVLGLLPVFFEDLVSNNLRLTALTASFTQLSGRAFQVALPWLAAVLVLDRIRCRYAESFGVSTHTAWPLVLLGIITGVGLAGSGASAHFVLVAAVMLFGASLLALTILTGEKRWSFSRRQAAWAVAVSGLIIGGAVIPPDTAANSRLLFSAHSFHRLRAGIDENLIRQSDPCRLLHSHVDSEGQLTVWRNSGDFLEVRRNGIPVGLVTEDATVAPQPIAEVAASVVGLTVQPDAKKIVVVGDELGANLRVCCGFPVTDVTAIRPDKSMTELASLHTWADMWMSPNEDERVHFVRRAPAIAVRSLPDNAFDVFVVSGGSPLDPGNITPLMSEFCQQVSRVLDDDGLFCQRIQQHDLGAESLVRSLSTLCDTFERVAMMQVIQGEILVLGTNSDQPILDRHFMNRLQREHVRTQLSRSGWDWSQIAGLAVIDVQDPVGIFKHETIRPPATAGNAYFALAVPLEAQRWGDKQEELRAVFGPHQMRVAEATPTGPAHEEFRRRISAVAQQTEILSHFPDQPWPYRSSLKSEMQRNPRPPVKEIRDGKIHRSPHPLDEYRKGYFVALGEALRQTSEGNLSNEALHDLTAFTNQYEPLLSYFAHHELVRIHELSGHPAPSNELQHRLHTVFYHQPGDYSIRHVTAAIDYLLENESLVPDEARQFDYLNAMLQELIVRWEYRRTYDPESAVVAQNDVDQSIQVANEALDKMLALIDSVGVGRDDFIARRKFVNTVLVSPLRDYRQAIVAHRAKNTSPKSSDDSAVEGDKPLLIDPTDLLTN